MEQSPSHATTGWEACRRQADRYFRASLALTAVLTAVWLFFVLTGRDGGPAFKGYQVSRKSVAGTWACFLGSFAICVFLVHTNGLPAPWVGLAVAISFSNTLFELLSPRGTDDFTMATGNALLCWAFGAFVL